MYFSFLFFNDQDVLASKIPIEDPSEKFFTDNGFCFPRKSRERSNYAPGRCKCSFTDMQPRFYSFPATIESFPTTQLLEATIRVKLQPCGSLFRGRLLTSRISRDVRSLQDRKTYLYGSHPGCCEEEPDPPTEVVSSDVSLI